MTSKSTLSSLRGQGSQLFAPADGLGQILPAFARSDSKKVRVRSGGPPFYSLDLPESWRSNALEQLSDRFLGKFGGFRDLSSCKAHFRELNGGFFPSLSFALFPGFADNSDVVDVIDLQHFLNLLARPRRKLAQQDSLNEL
jgi:hypothetical protein